MKNILIFIGLGLFSYYLIVNFTDFSPHVADILYSRGALVYTVIAFTLLGYVTIYISEWVNKRYIQNPETSGMSHSQNVRTPAFLDCLRRRYFTAANIIVGLLFLSINYSMCVIAKVLAGVQPVWAISPVGRRVLLLIWIAEMAVILLLLSNRTLKTNQRLKQEAARLQIENTKAKYDALQAQLNPHFLFNSLNTLIAEIQYNPDNAIRFTRHLSNVYRYVLQCHNRHLVTLGEELEFVDSFIFLHKVRLGDCLSCNIDIADSLLESELPPLTLQLLVENVIKHNSISQSRPMAISIRAADGYMVVSNPVSPKNSLFHKSEGNPSPPAFNSMPKDCRAEDALHGRRKQSGSARSQVSSGIGLMNLATRCRLVCERDISITMEDNTFTVKVPFAE
ncbi:MAG: sensor histidine kinase [Prevotella sp.]